MRATKSKHYIREEKADVKNTAPKKRRGLKVLSFIMAVTIAVAILIVPTTTLAPDVNAFENSKVASLSIGNLDEFAVIITDNCAIPTTVPATMPETTKEEPATVESAKSKATEADTKAVEKIENKKTESSNSENTSDNTYEVSEVVYDNSTTSSVSDVSTPSSSNAAPAYSGSYIFTINNPDYSYNPKAVNLTDYDRNLVERVVMREMGYMGYENCTLVAQCIRDAMNRSNTTSMDRIISEYGYGGSLAMTPNSDVKNAVSYIFDQTGSAVQHRLLCYYTGQSAWHETQNYVITAANCRFFDLWY